MPIPHNFRRSGGPKPYQEPANEKIVARTIAAQLGHMIDRADGAKLTTLAYLLDCARIEAERVAAADPAIGTAPGET